jgi:histidinol dehydrogenase
VEWQGIRVFRTADLSLEAIGARLLPAAGDDARAMADVEAIVARVRDEGDAAVLEYTRRFDWADATLDGLKASPAEMDAALTEIAPELLNAMTVAIEHVRRFHERQKPVDWCEEFELGLRLGQRHVPIDAVACYVPTRRASLPSSLIMSVVPAQVAGVRRIVVTGPPQPDGALPPGVLAAAHLLGITEVYKLGSAWGIAAFAYGTAMCPKVDKIVGPTSSYGSLAKRAVFGQVGIDGLNGPSDVTIVADGSVPARWIAADLLSLAEHGEDSPAYLVTPDADYARAVLAETAALVAASPRAEFLRMSLGGHAAVIITRDLAEAAAMANVLAPEHLELAVADPDGLLPSIRHAGAVFLGGHTPVATGDYLAGPSHILPTDRTARFANGLGVQDFLTRGSLIAATPAWLAAQRDNLLALAEHEGLAAHADSVRVRTETGDA